MSEHIIFETSDISCSFGKLKALDAVSLRVEAGAAVAVVGPNGSGKSTLLNVASGFVAPDAGTVSVGGVRVEGSAPWRIARHGVRRTFQHARLPVGMTVLELLVASASLPQDNSVLRSALRHRTALQERRAAVAHARELLGWLELPDFEDHRAGDLSGGQQKLIGLGAALMGRPRLLLLDEPMAGVNPTLRTKLADRLRELQARGTTVVFVEHDMKFVAHAADSVYVLDRGAVVAHSSPRELAANEAVRRAYLGSAAEHLAPAVEVVSA
ncbi:ABC transporter ATP-binding protein [Nocardia crassostreae]|uniref:ABC transporter ATP-binding protein n=1 Tax=Nocardia crassostreae TaxID=53428 RepID=UPI0008339596|nr:ATP-binding cassette domain-containing protein [Nocardia crassostreae]